MLNFISDIPLRHCLQLLITGGSVLFACACQPTVKLEAPDKPIEINLNVKIEQEVRVRVERDLEETIKNNPDLF